MFRSWSIISKKWYLTLLGGGGFRSPPLRENLHNSLLKLFFGVQKAMTFQSKVGLNFWNHFWPKKIAGGPPRAPENLKNCYFRVSKFLKNGIFWPPNPLYFIHYILEGSKLSSLPNLLVSKCWQNQKIFICTQNIYSTLKMNKRFSVNSYSYFEPKSQKYKITTFRLKKILWIIDNWCL